MGEWWDPEQPRSWNSVISQSRLLFPLLSLGKPGLNLAGNPIGFTILLL